MLTCLYIEALLVDEEPADQVWEAWIASEADDQTACIAWLLIAEYGFLTKADDPDRGSIGTDQVRGHWQ